MKKQKIFILIPLLLITGFLMYTWVIFLFTNEMVGTWRQYTALCLFVLPAVLFFNNFKASIVATAIYLALGVFNIVSLTPAVHSLTITVMGLSTPDFQPLALGLFILLLMLNLDTMVDMYLDYKGVKALDNNANKK